MKQKQLNILKETNKIPQSNVNCNLGPRTKTTTKKSEKKKKKMERKEYLTVSAKKANKIFRLKMFYFYFLISRLENTFCGS